MVIQPMDLLLENTTVIFSGATIFMATVDIQAGLIGSSFLYFAESVRSGGQFRSEVLMKFENSLNVTGDDIMLSAVNACGNFIGKI